MEKKYNDFIELLSSKYLEDIFKVNSIKLPGFRINGPNNPVKIKKMKNILLEDIQLKSKLLKTIEYYKKNYNKDYTWSLVTTIPDDLIDQLIQKYSVEEVMLGLINGDHEEKLYEVSYRFNEKKMLNDPNLLVDNKEVNEKDNDIMNLRDIVKKLEKEVHKYKVKYTEEKSKNNEILKAHNQLIEKNKKDNQIIVNEKTKIIEIKELYEKKINKIIEDKQIEIDKILSEYNKVKNNLESKKNEEILVVGNEVYKKYFDSNFKRNNYIYVENLLTVKDLKQYKRIIILEFTYNKNENEKNQNAILHFDNVITIKSTEELINMTKRMI